MKRIVAHEEHCVQCRLCEVACKVEHSTSKKVWQAYRENPRPHVGIELHYDEGHAFALACRHCEHADCMKACFAGAMTRDSEGIVHVDNDKCVGCWSCIMVCNYGAVAKGKDHKVAMKCDLCRDSVDGPACVTICPNEAITVIEV